MANQLELIGGAYGQILRDFLNVSFADDGTLKNAGATTLAAVLAAGNDAGARRITNLATPTVGSDATTKTYVDSLIVAAQTLAAVLAAGNDAGALAIANLADPTNPQDAATKHYVDAQDAATSTLNTVLTAGNDAGAHKIANLGAGSLSSDAARLADLTALTRTLAQVLAAGADAGAIRITNLGTPTVSTDAATKAYVDALTRTLAQVLAAGASAGGVTISSLGDPVNQSDAATKDYVDTETVNTQTAGTYTLVASDVGKCVICTNATGCTVTIPPNSSVPFEISPRAATIIVRAGASAGTVTIAGGAGVTVKNPYNSFSLVGQCAEVKLTKIGTDTWSVNGEVA